MEQENLLPVLQPLVRASNSVASTAPANDADDVVRHVVAKRLLPVVTPTDTDGGRAGGSVGFTRCHCYAVLVGDFFPGAK